jgi:hypothetical protein
MIPYDFDGDGKQDLLVYDPGVGPSGLFRIRLSSNGQIVAHRVPVPEPAGTGAHRYFPVPGDYDGDGICDLAVWHQQTSTWYIAESSKGGAVRAAQYGWGECVPCPGYYDGSGRCNIAVRAPDGKVYIHGIWEGDFPAPGNILPYGLGQPHSRNVWPAEIPIKPPHGGSFLWKPVGESDGKLLVMLPNAYGEDWTENGVVTPGAGAKVELVRPDLGVVALGRFHGKHDGRRSKWRFPQPGAAYQNVLVLATAKTGARQAWGPIGDGASRYE